MSSGTQSCTSEREFWRELVEICWWWWFLTEKVDLMSFFQHTSSFLQFESSFAKHMFALLNLQILLVLVQSWILLCSDPESPESPYNLWQHLCHQHQSLHPGCGCKAVSVNAHSVEHNYVPRWVCWIWKRKFCFFWDAKLTEKPLICGACITRNCPNFNSSGLNSPCDAF